LQDEDIKEGWLLKQMAGGFGPVFSITMKEQIFARRLPSKLQLFHHATSLGGVESLIEWRTMVSNLLHAIAFISSCLSSKLLGASIVLMSC
jgi:cystathionine beta-lyase